MKQQAATIELHNGNKLYSVMSSPVDRSIESPDKTLVVMIHDIPYGDYREHEDLFSYVRAIFNEHGYQTLMFDFESCGESDGKQEDFDLETVRRNLKEVLVWAQMRGFEKFIFVASGVGSAFALEFSNEKVPMVFLFWPVVDLALHARGLFYDGLNKVIARGRKIGGKLVEQMEHYDPKLAMKSLKIPILIQYGAEDEEVSLSHTDYIKKNFKALRIDITSYLDGKSGLTNPRHRVMIAHHIGAFLDKYS